MQHNGWLTQTGTPCVMATALCDTTHCVRKKVLRACFVRKAHTRCVRKAHTRCVRKAHTRCVRKAHTRCPMQSTNHELCHPLLNGLKDVVACCVRKAHTRCPMQSTNHELCHPLLNGLKDVVACCVRKAHNRCPMQSTNAATTSVPNLEISLTMNSASALMTSRHTADASRSPSPFHGVTMFW
jgi:hypothetical protein